MNALIENLSSIVGTLLCVATAMIGYTLHGSLFWAIVDLIFAPLVWCKWLICREVNLSLIKETFGFFLK